MVFGITEIAELTIAAILMGLCVGYFWFIRPRKKSQKEEEEHQAAPEPPKPEPTQVPMGELPTGLSDKELDKMIDESLKSRDSD